MDLRRATRISCKASAACGSLGPKRRSPTRWLRATYGPRPEIVFGERLRRVRRRSGAGAPHALLLERDGMGRGRTDRLLAGRQLRDAAMADGGWTAKWITDRHDKNFAPSPMLRKSFTVKDGVREARLYMSAAAYGKMTGERRACDREQARTRLHALRQAQPVCDLRRDEAAASGRERRGRRARQRLLQRDSARGDMGFRGRPLARPRADDLRAVYRLRRRHERGDRFGRVVEDGYGSLSAEQHLQRRHLRRPSGDSGLGPSGLRRPGSGSRPSR